MEDVPMKDLAISYPVIVSDFGIQERIVNLDSDEPGMVGGADANRERGPGIGLRPNRGTGNGSENDGLPERKILKLQRIDFVIQFCWQPKTPSERLKAKEQIKPTKESGGFATNTP